MIHVAERAGVSQAAVSYVLNGLAKDRRISPATELRIHEACRELGYRGNYLAKAMATRKTAIVGVIFTNALGDFMGQMIRGAQEILQKQQRQILLCIADDDPKVEAEALDIFEYRHVDGVIAFPVWTPTRSRHWRRYLNLGRPTAFLGLLPEGVKDAVCVGIDEYRAGFEAAERFAADGAKQVVLAEFEPERRGPSVVARQQGFLDGARNAGYSAPLVASVRDYDTLSAVFRGQRGACGVYCPVTQPLVDALTVSVARHGPAHSDIILASVGLHRDLFLLPNRWWMACHPTVEMGRNASRYVLSKLGEDIPVPSSLTSPFTWQLNRLGTSDLEVSRA